MDFEENLLPSTLSPLFFFSPFLFVLSANENTRKMPINILHDRTNVDTINGITSQHAPIKVIAPKTVTTHVYVNPHVAC